ncbi:MAG: hypothetical protein LBE71_04420 [Dysgonamonadaceae bacterium]|jgi:hypothetical protein|nr:hypothetical protein [Dysgonamonadaceae bacterium]
MVDTIIFSFDRAMQLSFLLESIVRRDIHKYLNINILFCYSAAEYKKAYEKLQNRYPQFQWMKETIHNKPELNFDFDFCYWHNYYWWLKYKHLRKNKSNFKQIIRQILSSNRNELVMFLTDDSVFYRNIEIPDIRNEKTAFSLRHGKHLAGGEYKETENAIEWNVYENNEATDWGYPFSVDGHIYNKARLLKIIRKIIFNNPNTMEGNIACHFKEKHLFPQMKANKCSCLAGFELNRVQAIVDNHHLGISQEQLNRYFLDDYQLQIQFDTAQIQYFRPEIESIYAQKKEEKIKIYP